MHVRDVGGWLTQPRRPRAGSPQEAFAHSCLDVPHQAKADAAAPVVGAKRLRYCARRCSGVVTTSRRAARARCRRRRCVPIRRRRPGIVVEPAILDPLEDISERVLQPECVRRKRADRRECTKPSLQAAPTSRDIVPPRGVSTFAERQAAAASAPHGVSMSVPPRAAYSHSDAVGSRYAWPVFCDNHAA